MLKIRLQRVGKKHDPAFRIVLIDSARVARSGYVNEVLGFYSAKREQTKLSGEKIKEWISKRRSSFRYCPQHFGKRKSNKRTKKKCFTT